MLDAIDNEARASVVSKAFKPFTPHIVNGYGVIECRWESGRHN
jgi:hypothetical protein